MTSTRPWRPTPLCHALCLALGVSLAPSAVHGASPSARPGLTAATADAQARYAQAVLDDRVDDTYRALEAQAARAPAPQRAALLLLVAQMKWRQGLLAEADAAVDRALAAGPAPAAWRLKAELLDAQGQPRQALAWFQKAMDATSDRPQRDALALRMAVMRASAGEPEALERFAAQAPEALRWRAALVLGLLGQADRALALGESAGQPARSFDAELRLADWALRAGDTARARHHAWQAVERASATVDRRYALAVWVEACRAADDLAGAAQALAARAPTPDFTQVRVDLLLELGRPHEAQALIERSPDPALRQRLLAVLQATGRTADVEGEYRRLIAAQPGQLRWTEGLAEFYLAQGREQDALRAYEQLLERHRGQPDLVVAGARSMIARGLADAAEQVLARMPQSPELAEATRGLLLERFLDQGDEERALALLDGWLAGLPPASADRLSVAEGYERLGRTAQALAVLQALGAAGGRLDDDQQAHVAELLSATGDEAQALARWRALWARARLPARKDFLERKIVSSAQRLGLLRTLADELQARQVQGLASTDEINLLLSLRIASFDGDGVQAAVQAYAQRSNLGEQARLEQLARVQARMRNGPGLVVTLRSLARLDRRGAPDYLRQALQTVLQQGGAHQPGQLPAQAREIVDELQATSGLGSAENSRYLAGIYAASGMPAQALALYRRALAQAPQDSDNLLQLADALKTSGHASEAASLLQQAALSAGRSGEFTNAISGLLDLFTAAPDARDDGDSSLGLRASRLSWALRQVLLRIAQDGDDVRLNSLVADIAQSQESAPLQLRAYEATLPIAQDQRPAVLRQLIALTSGQKAGEPGALPRAADLPRKIAFGRRLIALRQDFAAGVYVDLARALLAAGDLPGAERAFAMVDEGGGLTNLAALRAGAYAEAGRTDEALASYRLALLRDPDDQPTIVAASLLREREGQAMLAWHAYWRGLLSLLGRQPLLRDGLSESAALDATQYLPTLLEGALLNWPRSAPAGEAALASWRRLFEQTLAKVDPRRPLRDQLRLQTLVQVNRRLAEHVAPDAGLPALEDAVAARLPQDKAFSEERLAYGHLVGATPATAGDVSADADAGDEALQALAQQARHEGPPGLRLVLALMRKDDAALRDIAERALAAELRGREARRANVAEPPGTLGAWLAAARSAVGRLPGEQLDALLVRPLERTPYRDDVLFDLYRGDLRSFNALERSLGRRLVDNDTLLSLLATRFGEPLPEAAIRRVATLEPGAAQAVLERFSTDERLRLMDRLVERMEQGGPTSGLLDTLLADLLQQTLPDAQQARLLAITARMTGVSTPGDELGQPSAAAGNIRRLVLLDVPPARRAPLLEMARRFAAQAPEAEALPGFLQAWYAGDDAAAYAALQRLQDVLREPRNGGVLQLPLPVITRLAAQREQDIEAFLALPQPSAAAAAAFYRRHVHAEGGWPGPDPAELVRWYRALLRAAPDSPVYLQGLLAQHAQAQDFVAFAQDLQPYVQSQPGDRDAATLLGLTYRLLGKPERAAAVADAAGVDLDDADGLTALWDMSRDGRPGRGAAALRPLFGAVFEAYRSSPAMPASVLAALPERLRPVSDADVVQPMGARDEPWGELLALPADSPGIAGRLRQRWRESLGVGEAMRGARSQLVASLPGTHAMPGDGPDAARLRSLLLRRADLNGELEAYLQAMEPAARQSQPKLYQLVAQGLVAQGRADARRQQLLGDLAGGRLGAHGLQLLGALVDVQRRGLEAPDLQRLAVQLRQLPVMAPAERLLFARVFARSGQDARAESLLRATVLQLLYVGSSEEAGAAASAVSLAEVNAALSLFADRRRAVAVHQALRDLVADSRARDATGGRHPEPFPPHPPTAD
ncbi:tetratricopeptide repeat protein [Roseateles cellulosilyticus]|uniref:Tetratricopeptide repeat protein n=1 Tax=Pelomonas cellulosilytica TaxID=2906762 RepID=A0ABS8Y2I8_9BURK|nr:tetratricopeptide repeat protein [Pelomonas sp. P8]MCE4557943.1 tetratricopeptide repeat protein [Pelomonas sp. P8]